MRIKFSRVLPFLLVSSVLSGCATTSSTGDAPLNQGNWPLCSAIGALAGGGLGAIESSTWAAGGAVAGALLGTIICYAQDGDEDGDGVFDRRDRCPSTPAGTAVGHNGCPLPQYPASVAAEPAMEQQAQDEVIVLSDLGNVLFAFDSAELTGEARRLLADVGTRLTGASLVAVKVVGHTDSVGSDATTRGCPNAAHAVLPTFSSPRVCLPASSVQKAVVRANRWRTTAAMPAAHRTAA
jgi:hypothetical protein